MSGHGSSPFKEKRAKTVSERIFRAGENSRVFVSTDLILASAFP